MDCCVVISAPEIPFIEVHLYIERLWESNIIDFESNIDNYVVNNSIEYVLFDDFISELPPIKNEYVGLRIWISIYVTVSPDFNNLNSFWNGYYLLN